MKDLHLQACEARLVPSPYAFTGLERILLTANGNLQRIVSALHDAPVYVQVLENKRIPGECSCFSRCVLLQVTEERRTFGVAYTRMQLEDARLLEYYERERPALGQFFQHFHVQPRFELKRIGRGWDSAKENHHICPTAAGSAHGESAPSGGSVITDRDTTEYPQVRAAMDEWKGRNVWREYTLQAEGVSCWILEILDAKIAEMPR